ncbi:aldo/keto reductase [Acutalibacter caecimuris]|uniref:aldo/keto reductase n=1 Tax=Acutalibacter caecimuris TaxID=3093657 RepID=UPI002AC93DBB|nr:aldo/keto reductase [Acutalibacter sp. M00118]
MAEKYLGQDIKKLGFGLMRLPMQGEEIDMEQVKQMVDAFMEKGFTYFDTAYVYIGGKSEVALKEAVVDRYPRDSFQCATKLPLWDLKEPADMERVFQESLDRAGLSYYDFYLLHALGKESAQKAEDLGAWAFIKQLKEQGRAKHIGFSFHDSADVLEDILSKHPEAEFVQLQINYADWDSDGVQARLCYETARRHGKAVIIMEPVKGGALATMTPEVQGIFKAADPNASVASWAVRYAASLDGLITVLSGMSDLAQMRDNLSYMADFQPLSSQERAVVAQVVDVLKNTPTIPCTACKYCVDGCPQKINIPGAIAAMNQLTLYGDLSRAQGHYKHATAEGGKASACIQCGACQSHCPQHLEIINHLQSIAGKLE